MKWVVHLALGLGIAVSSLAQDAQLSPELAECLDNFRVLSRVSALATEELPPSPYQIEQRRLQSQKDIDHLFATLDQALARARIRESNLRDQLEVTAVPFRLATDVYVERLETLRELSEALGRRLEEGHPVLESYLEARSHYSAMEHSLNRTRARLRITEAYRMRTENHVARLYALKRRLEGTSITDSHHQELLGKIVFQAEEVYRSLSPLEIQLLNKTEGTSVEFDEVRRSQGQWILVEAKSASGFHHNPHELENHPETGVPFANREAQWVYKHLLTKTDSKMASLKQAAEHPENFETLGSKDVTALVPTPEELARIRVLRFEMEEFSGELRAQVKIALQELKRRYPDWTFEFGFGRQAPR